MKFSLIMATYGRSHEIKIFCESLLLQSEQDFELIIVDQNTDNRVIEIIQPYQSLFTIKYIKSTVKGLSYNRNIGLKHAIGEIIAFPDDDCIYLKDTLQFIEEKIKKDKTSFYCLNTKDTKRDLTYLTPQKRWNINYYNFMRGGCSPSFFVTKNALEGFYFDEKLGVGAPFGSAEESDMLLYLLVHNKKGIYDGNHFILHPGMDYKATIHNDTRNYTYALGFGALYKKGCLIYKKYFLIIPFLVSLLKCFAGIIIRDKKKYTLTLKGRIKGFLLYRM